ncbi:bifunctional [glutamine synthetase] adenylyltransferase/[glutamine synthetase]-adenylyl-L-tyrosine phosphorylase [Lichenifustis flavocetrariae]|uniref:Bifunctional glutamine synthetase adenylyltransferase/adenylyl-removing enzyme n=1 Tax=Lichenifustis flavocetrariae TaxID=2949735 RepID=A0AA41YX29_9HYPH|nr:bifunctional [glutamine synthetase] adenylyltransferase/[glutamine synthetase]-adenylyl-L-tyrosine phosphorylase [Lichenifustis flavocetrariae]MCW6506533.1 bifunctional [glutamine synthetase] adenylyltransferase/[glutamine synthetase]-adenylyl-L-tyrosine phosphorylase [Lichenifustis flavocetrariae]
MRPEVASGHDGRLCDLLRTAPVVSDGAVADDRLTVLGQSLPESSSLKGLLDQSRAAALLRAVADHSPFLWRLIDANPERCARLLQTAPETALDGCLSTLHEQLSVTAIDVAGAMRALRLARQEVALLVALADLGGVWSLDQVTQALTRFADQAVAGALMILIREACRSGKLRPDASPDTCGLVVLALGKGGAFELNYSSDIDLVVLFDPRATALADSTIAGPFYVRLTQSLARLLQERTQDGFVLRVDLRLRPDPASTAVAVSLPSAFSYYETLGQNWERAAFIKARPVAGDKALGARFLADLAPFMWRKYFDFGAIADIHAMKRQIHAVRGQGTIAIADHNIKLGRGGIREIEFFVQTQQLIFGGRRPALRGSQTCAMLRALAADGWIDQVAVEDLSAAYRFLRTVEHRLQMVDDQQTQRLPAAGKPLAHFARFSGFDDALAFSEALLEHLRKVEHHYARLFEHAPALDAAAGSLVFTGTEHDPETLETLSTMGFDRPGDAVELIRGWHFGRRAAVQSARAREVLTELVPVLLAAFAAAGDPDAALAAFDTMLGRMSSAVELLSLLRSNETLRLLFADILGAAPRLAATVAQRPHVLDAAIDPALLTEGTEAKEARIDAMLAAASSTEECLDRMRDLAQEEWFLIGIRALSGAQDPTALGEAYTFLADILIRAALARCLADMRRDHGVLQDGACVVLGMGRLGSRELTATSDLDLILVYRANPGHPTSDGPRPLDAVRYYTRLTQRLIASLTAPTRRGRLYDVDLRLRPSGGQGPLATKLSAFLTYQITEAQTWEHMALTRNRVIGGDATLAAELNAAIMDVLCLPRSPLTLRDDIVAMRSLVAEQKSPSGLWDMKLAPGGLLDIEFLAQFILLRSANLHPSLCQRNPATILRLAGKLGVIDAETALILVEAYELQTTLTQFIRLTTGELGSGLHGVKSELFCRAANQPDLPHLESLLQDTRNGVRRLFRTLLTDEADMAAVP